MESKGGVLKINEKFMHHVNYLLKLLKKVRNGSRVLGYDEVGVDLI